MHAFRKNDVMDALYLILLLRVVCADYLPDGYHFHNLNICNFCTFGFLSNSLFLSGRYNRLMNGASVLNA